MEVFQYYVDINVVFEYCLDIVEVFQYYVDIKVVFEYCLDIVAVLAF